MDGDLFLGAGEQVEVEDLALLLDGVEELALGVEIVQQADDGHFRLVELLIFEEVAEQLERVDGAQLHLRYLVPALRQIRNEVEVLHEVQPGGLVLLLALLVELPELVALGARFVQTSADRNPAVFLDQLYLVETVGFLEDLDEVVEDEFLVVGVDGLADDAEQPEDLEVLLLVVVSALGLGDVVAGEVLDDLAVDEVIDEEEVVPE